MNWLWTVRHRGFYSAIGLGIIAALAMLAVSRELALVVGFNVFFVVYLVMVAVAGPRLTPAFLRQHADEEDAPALLIFFAMLAAVAVSAGSLFVVLMNGAKETMPLQLWLSIGSVILGWLAVHMMWAMHYAYEFYQSPSENASKPKKGDVAGGLQFPGGDAPDGTAFLYFSYVIGMTAQTSDTAVCSNAMRRIVAVHGIFSFFFNTVIVAAAVNIVVTLAH